MKKQITLITLLVLIAIKSIAQQNAAQNPLIVNAAMAELQKRGIKEEDVRKRLLERGIDIDNIKIAELPYVQKQIEEVVAQLEQEKEKEMTQTKQEIDNTDTTGVDIDTENVQKQNDIQQNKKDIQQKQIENAQNKKEIPETKIENNQTYNTNTRNNNTQQPNIKNNARLPKKKTKIQTEIAKTNTIEELLTDKTNKLELDTTKEEIFGQNIFKNGELKIIKDKEARASDNYIINTGDKITVSIAGTSYYNATLEVKKDGAIEPERMPKIFVRGITLFQAKKIIQGSFSRFYRFNKEDFDASINTVRTVNISIVGEVTNPGSYTLSGANTALNALVAANGLKGIASPRNIQIIHANGEKKKLDVYQFLSTPSVTQDFFLFDNDFISVPVAERVVKIQGAVRRPHKYELINRENLKKLIEYAGGFADNAVQTNVQIKRYIDDKEKIIDVNYQNIQGTNTDFDVRNGDIVIVKTIPKTYENYVNVIGSVDLIGDYQIDNGMRVSDVLKKARLRPEARTDVAYLQRLNTDKTMSLKFLNLDDVLNNSASPYNLLLMPKDRLLIYPKSQFAQQDSLFVTGAVRTELRFPYDPQRTIRVSDLINLAGGLSADATDFAYIIRRDTKNYKFVEYKRIALQKAIDLPNSDENVVLQPNDQLKIQSRTTFVDEATVSVSGAVRQIGTYPWDKTLSLTDVLTLAGGLKLEAASNRIDVFRILLNGNEEVKTVVATVEVDKNLNVLNAADNFALQPYDQIVVRSIPEFNFQKTVTLSGELRYAGAYALIDKNEKITNLLLRAGGVTAEAFLPGATIYRQQDEIGYIVIKLDEAIKNPQSNYNIIMKDGDIVDIPKTKDIVTIKGATLATELYPEKILAGGKINVAYDGSHTVWYYVDKYAAGIGKDGRKRLISVEHPNGQIERTKDYLLFKSYPRVQKGSIITVGYVEKKKEYPKTETKRVDWSRVLADSVAQATALLTLIILVNKNL